MRARLGEHDREIVVLRGRHPHADWDRCRNQALPRLHPAPIRLDRALRPGQEALGRTRSDATAKLRRSVQRRLLESGSRQAGNERSAKSLELAKKGHSVLARARRDSNRSQDDAERRAARRALAGGMASASPVSGVCRE